MRYPDKFKIQPIVETREGGDFVYEDDPTREPFIFKGRIAAMNPSSAAKLLGALTKTTHTIYCSLLDFEIQTGETVFEYSTEKEYEVLFSLVGQKNLKLWVALT